MAITNDIFKPKLSLNKHPKDCDNLSLINAENVRLSNDNSVLQSDNSLLLNENINTFLTENYPNGYEIIDYIPCNIEFILFIIDNNTDKPTQDNPAKIDLIRYNEKLNNPHIAYKGFNWYGGPIKGTFTYNITNELIIAIAEDGLVNDIPLRTIRFKEGKNYNDQLPNELLSINPEVKIPSVINYNYKKGQSYKGWYYYFLRYKIDDVDYTQWYSISNKILVCDIEKQAIIKYYGYSTDDDVRNPFSSGAIDHFNNGNDISEETIELEINNIDNNYKKCQIAFICVRNDYTKCYCSKDIFLKNNNLMYLTQTDLMDEYDIEELLTTDFVPLNIRNIINYQNRLYIAGYEENNVKEEINDIILNLEKETLSVNDIKSIGYKQELVSEEKETYIPYETDEQINDDKIENDDTIELKIIPNIEINGEKYNTSISKEEDLISNIKEFKNEIKLLKYSDFLTFLKGKFKSSSFEYKFIEDFYIFSKYNKKIKITFECVAKNSNKDDVDSQVIYNNYDDNKEWYINFANCYFYITDGINTYKTQLYGKLRIDAYSIKRIQYAILDIGITQENLNEIFNSINYEFIDYKNNGEYINTKLSFQERRKKSTLIPDEIYNFFIHYVDKYGNITNGYKINNNIKYYDYDSYIEGTKQERVLIPIGTLLNDKNHISSKAYFYIEVLADANIDFNNIPLGRCAIYFINKISNNEYYGDYESGVELDADAIRDITAFLIEKYMFVTNFERNITWRELPEAGIIDNFGLIKNSNGESLFKVPFNYIKRTQNTLNNIYYKNYEYPIYSFRDSIVEIPNNYIGYFYSYEQVESQIKATGILTKYDLEQRKQSEDLILYNELSSQDIKFYCSELDIEDNFNLKFNCIRLEFTGVGDTDLGNNILTGGILEDMINLNLTAGNTSQPYFKYININDIDIKIAGDAKKNRYGLGTCISFNINDLKVIDPITLKEVSLESVLFPEDDEYGNEPRVYIASLMYITKDIYLNDDKKLIKCSNIVYNNEELKLTFDGCCTYNNFIIYNNNKVIFNKITGEIYKEDYKPYYDFKKTSLEIDSDKTLNNKFLRYVQLPVYKNYFFETKEFNNPPEITTIQLTEITEEDTELSDYAKLANGLFVEPINSIDLFKNKYTNSDLINPYTFTNYDEDDKYIHSFNKTIRRSDIIQDESFSNAWRKFRLENYKIITENKGNITNLINTGKYLLVHTEHSMFIFTNDNTLQTQNQDILLANSDIFSLNYQEAIITELGYGGLQDDKSWIITNFGYIYYDNDSRKIFKFADGNIQIISDNIVNFLDKYKPNKIRFADDKYNNRLLLSIDFNDINGINNKCISYNYLINEFISFHNYKFDEAFSTKNNLYLLKKDIDKIKIYNFDKNELNNNNYNLIENTKNINKCKLDIIINTEYDIIKILNNIVYKLYKYKINKTEDYTNSPVEGQHLPYSGEQIRIFNNEVDTGWLDIKIAYEGHKNQFMNYEKPYWHLGNWNFNYLRNKISEQLGSDYMSKLYGNYFIVSIIFGDSNERVEFESLGYNIIKG